MKRKEGTSKADKNTPFDKPESVKRESQQKKNTEATEEYLSMYGEYVERAKELDKKMELAVFPKKGRLNERYQYPRASGLPTESGIPEGNAWDPRHFVPSFRPKGRGISTRVSGAYPAIPALAREWNQQVASAPLASFGNKEEKEQESEQEFRRQRNRHSGIESAIHALHHKGLDRCPNHGKLGFDR